MELMAYLAILGVLLTLIYSVYYEMSYRVAAADKTLLKERGAFSAVRTMQGDIRRSSETLDAFGPFTASGGALILSIEHPDEAESEIVIYRLAESEGTLMRHETFPGRPSYGVSTRRTAFFVEEFNFSADEKNANLLRVTIRVETGRRGVLQGQPVTFHALMRNG